MSLLLILCIGCMLLILKEVGVPLGTLSNVAGTGKTGRRVGVAFGSELKDWLLS
jgi:hypothetical protein